MRGEEGDPCSMTFSAPRFNHMCRAPEASLEQRSGAFLQELQFRVTVCLKAILYPPPAPLRLVLAEIQSINHLANRSVHNTKTTDTSPVNYTPIHLHPHQSCLLPAVS